MTYQEVLENARTCMGPYCKACPACNGMGCRNTMPGPGAKGIGTGFIRNYQKWQELCVNMDTICENKEVDTSYELFGHRFALPVFAAPVGAMQLHYGDKYDDLQYNDILVSACAKAGIAAFTGDGTNPAVMEGAVQAIRAAGGWAVLAHPGQIAGVDRAGLAALVDGMAGQGLSGLEVFYPGQDADFRDFLLQQCRARRLVPTLGSDYHGPDRPGNALLCTYQPALIPQETWDFVATCLTRHHEGG